MEFHMMATYAKLRMSLKTLRKGGDQMSEIREPLTKVLNGVVDGIVPLDTAEVVSKVADKHVKDRNADDREERRVGFKEMMNRVDQAQEKIKNI